MDTERLLKSAQEYFDHEHAPYVGGATLLAGAVVWFYATDINRVLKVSLTPRFVDKLLSHLSFLAYCLPPRLPAEIGQSADSWSTGRHPYHTVHGWASTPSRPSHHPRQQLTTVYSKDPVWWPNTVKSTVPCIEYSAVISLSCEWLAKLGF